MLVEEASNTLPLILSRSKEEIAEFHSDIFIPEWEKRNECEEEQRERFCKTEGKKLFHFPYNECWLYGGAGGRGEENRLCKKFLNRSEF